MPFTLGWKEVKMVAEMNYFTNAVPFKSTPKGGESMVLNISVNQ